MPKKIGKCFLCQWGLLILVQVLLGGAVAHNLYKIHHDIMEGERHRLLTQARVINENIASQIEATDNVLKFIIADLEGLPPSAWSSVMQNKRMQVFEQVVPGIRILNAVDVTGQIRLSNRRELIGRDLSQRDYFKQARSLPNTNLVMLSAPFKTLLGVWGMNLVRVVKGPDGQFNGVISATLNPKYFETLLRSVNYSPDMLSAVIHGDGLLFSMFPEQTELSGKNLSLPGTFFTRHLDQGSNESLVDGIFYVTNDQRLAALKTFSSKTVHLDRPLVVLTGRKLSSITADWRSHSKRQAATFSIICLLSFVALTLYQRRRRVQVLQEEQTAAHLRKLTHGIENSASAVMITDVEGRIEYVNKKFCQLTGFSASEAIGHNPRILKSDSTPREVFDNLWKTILAGDEWRGELLNRRKTGEVYWSIASISPLRDDQGEITHFIANVEDINERKNAEATIERLAYFDPLTDLPNRRMLQDRLELALKRSRRQASCTALLYLDLDRFKHINDSLGHPAGDKLLREMAHRLCEVLRDDDIVCRLGGDEFAVILHDIKNDKDVASVTHKLLDAMSAPLELDGCEVVVTASIGIALFPKDGDDCKTLEKYADIALYHAKEEGKNTFRFFQEELNTGSIERIAMEQGLRQVLSRNELELHYQPKVSVATGKVVGVEALVRWNSPEFGMVSPLRFIPMTEENRLIIPIGEWVLRTACQQQLAWQKQGIKLSMAINLSAVQFKTPQFVDRIAAIIDETGICPENLELELTESILVERPDDAVRVLEQIRSLGCGIAIDDFGTGYSSLSYLKMFPVTVLKIDRSFVRDLTHDSGDRAIAQSVVSLASNLNMQTVAEGVEEPEQLEILRQLGCTYIQGFIYSRPVLAEQIPAVIRSLSEKA